jgi:hypothetical protein
MYNENKVILIGAHAQLGSPNDIKILLCKNAPKSTSIPHITLYNTLGGF